MLTVHAVSQQVVQGITKRLLVDPNYMYVCRRCNGEARSIDDRTVTEMGIDGTMLDMGATFCYLGDMLCSNGGCDSAIAGRCCVVCEKFRKLARSLARSAMTHASETWGPDDHELQRLRRLPALERKDGIERHGLNVRRLLVSVIVV